MLMLRFIEFTDLWATTATIRIVSDDSIFHVLLKLLFYLLELFFSQIIFTLEFSYFLNQSFFIAKMFANNTLQPIFLHLKLLTPII